MRFERPSRPAVLLVIFALFLMGTTVLWLRLDRLPAAWDDAWYLTNSLVMFDALVAGGLAGYARQFLTVLGTKPPLITLLPTPIYILLGRNPGHAHVVNLLFIPVLLGSVYWIGRRFWSGRAGVFAAWIVGTMPMLYGLARWYLIDFALTAWVCVIIALMIRLLDSPSLRRAVFLGVALGLGMLLKVSFPVYVALPFLFFFVRYARGKRPVEFSEPAPGRIGTLLAIFLPAVLLPLPWYVLNFRRTLELALKAGFSEEADIYGTGDVFSLHAIKTYLVHLVNAGPSAYYAGLLLFLILLILLSPGRRALTQSFSRDAGILLLLWALPFLLFLFGRNKNVRYAAPFLPILALLLSRLLDAALQGPRKWRTAAACAVLAFPFVALLQTSFGVLGNSRLTAGGFVLLGGDLDYARMYDRNAWPLRQILQTIANQIGVEPEKKRALMLGTDRASFNANNFELAVAEARLPLNVTTAAYESSPNDALELLRSASFFLYEEGGMGESLHYNRFRDALIEEVQVRGNFIEIPCAINLPDGGRARVFKNLAQYSYLLGGAFIPSGAEPAADLTANFADRILLTEISLLVEPPHLNLKMRWQCLNPVERDYWCFAHILSEKGDVLGFLDHKILDGEPRTSSWRRGDAAVEYLRYRLQPPFAEGTVRLRMGLYNPATGERLRVAGYTGSPGLRLQLTDDGTALLVAPALRGSKKVESGEADRGK